MKSKIFLALLTISLASCTPATTLTPSGMLSATRIPTFTIVPQTPTASPTETITSTPSLTPLPLFPLDGYVIFFTRNGDLYFQDRTNSPSKVTQVGEGYTYILSDDNRKVVVYDPYSYAYDNLGHSINIDGTQSRPILPSGWPDKNLLWGTNLGDVEFIPGTHQLILSTHLCNSYDNPTSCVSSIFLTNTDTGEINKLADLGFSGSLRHEIFLLSPNGKMIAVTEIGYVDIFGINGKMIRHDILPYKPNTPDVLFPSVSWLPDSSGLIVALPNTLGDSVAYDYVPASTIWRYTINNNVAVQIRLDPAPMFDTFRISPDGNWIVYGGLGYEPSVYLGNLKDGHTKIVGEDHQTYFTWGPDSRHFIASSAGTVLGAIDTPMFAPACQPIQWIDPRHFTCLYNADGRIRMGEIDAGAIKIYDLGFGKAIESSVFMKPK